jgi:DNA-binding CsgD family transcriptional regulator
MNAPSVVEWFVAQCHRRWGLTRAETTVLLMVARGLQCQHIGRLVGAPTKTVEVHRDRALDKLGARSSGHAVALIWPLVVDAFLVLDCVDSARTHPSGGAALGPMPSRARRCQYHGEVAASRCREDTGGRRAGRYEPRYRPTLIA